MVQVFFHRNKGPSMWNNRAYKEIGQHFEFLFNEHQFQVFRRQGGNSKFGSLLETGSDELHVRFAVDRGHPYIDVSAPGCDVWCSLASIHKLIRGSWLTSQTNKMEDLSSFLQDHYRDIVELFKPYEVARTIARVEDAERKWRSTYFK